MEKRSSYRIRGNEKVETKEIYFSPDEIEISLDAEEEDTMDVGIYGDFEADYERITGDKLIKTNVFQEIAKLFQKAAEYVEQGWENVRISIRTTGEHSLAIEFRNTTGGISPIWADIVISVEDINKDCAEKLVKIREIIDSVEVT